MIPKVIHYCWFGGKPLPKLARKCMNSWKEMCPDYTITRWDEDSFNVNCHPFCEAAHASQAWAFVSDYARLKVVYENGGIYLDVDVELLKPLDDLLDSQCYIGVEQADHLCATGLGFGAIKFSPVVQKLLMKYDEITFDYGNLQKIACPILNHTVFSEMGYEYSDEVVDLGDAVVYPSRYFDPYTPSGNTGNLLCEETYSISHYGYTWGDPISRFKLEIQRLLGYNRMVAIRNLIDKAVR